MQDIQIKDSQIEDVQTEDMQVKTIKEQKILPAFSSNNIALLFAASDNYMPYFSTILQSILENSSQENNYDLLVFHRNITKEKEDSIAKQIAEYKNFSVRFYNVEESIQKYLSTVHLSGYYTIEIYYRLLAPYLLTEYDKILYLDSDMIVKSDIAKLYLLDLEEKYLLAACRDINWVSIYNSQRSQRKYVQTALKLQQPKNYFQSGVVLFNLKAFRATFQSEEIMQFATTQSWQLPDQDILNCLAEDKVLYLEKNWNVLYNWPTRRLKIIKKHVEKTEVDDYLQARENPFIIHYAGPEKPWVYDKVDFGEVWWQYAKDTPYSQELKNQLEIKLKERKKFKNRLKHTINKLFMPIVNLFFPHGSKRREKLKKKFWS